MGEKRKVAMRHIPKFLRGKLKLGEGVKVIFNMKLSFYPYYLVFSHKILLP